MLKPNTQGDGIEKWSLWEVVEGACFPFPSCENIARGCHLWEIGPHQILNLLTLDLSSLNLYYEWQISIVYKLPGLRYFVTAAQTKTLSKLLFCSQCFPLHLSPGNNCSVCCPNHFSFSECHINVIIYDITLWLWLLSLRKLCLKGWDSSSMVKYVPSMHEGLGWIGSTGK
jgi:hypothetical protein